jgi:hypothetical protein
MLWAAVVGEIDRSDFEADGTEGSGDDEGFMTAPDSAQFDYGVFRWVQ